MVTSFNSRSFSVTEWTQSSQTYVFQRINDRGPKGDKS